MKKTSLQICSVVGLVILMAVVSAKAQMQYRANIPFDFTIGQKSFEAGNYFVHVLNPDVAHKVIAIREAKGRGSYMMTATVGEDYSKVKMPSLVFNRNETQYSLARISTPSFIAKLPKSKTRGTLAGNQKVQQEIVAVAMKN